MPEMLLRQPAFTYSACVPITKNKDWAQKFKETGDSRYIYQKELAKACFQHDMAYGYFKDLPTRTTHDKVLCDKAFNIAKNPKFDGYQRELDWMVYKFLDKKFSGGNTSGYPVTHRNKSAIKSEIVLNRKLAKELHKPISRKFAKHKAYLFLKGNIWNTDLANMHLISKSNKGFVFLLCGIDIFSKYAWVVSLKDKKSITVTKA